MHRHEVPESIEKELYEYVRADLIPSRPTVHLKVGGAIGLGGIVSLFLCGQLGFGLTALAMSVHGALMGVAGFFGCTVVCGVLFAVVPVMALKLMTTGIQFLVIIRKEWRAISGWTVAFGCLLAYQNDRSDPLWVLLLWALAAIGSFGIISRAVHKASAILSPRLAPF